MLLKSWSPRVNDGVIEIAEDMLRRSLDMVRRITIPNLRNDVLSVLALALAKTGRLRDLKEVLRLIDDKIVSIQTLKKIGIELARSGYYEMSLKIVEDLYRELFREDTSYSDGMNGEGTYVPTGVLDGLSIRDELLEAVALQAMKRGDLGFASKMVNSIVNPYIRVVALSELALAFRRFGSIGNAIRKFVEAMNIVDDLNRVAVGQGRIYDLNMLSRNIVLTGTIALKIQVAGLNEWSREIMGSVIDMLSQIYDDKYRLETLTSLMKNIRLMDLDVDAEDLVEYAIGEVGKPIDRYFKVQILKEVALYNYKRKRLSNFIVLIRDAIDLASRYELGRQRDELLKEIALDCIRMGIVGCPQYLVEKIASEEMKLEVLCELASTMFRKGYGRYGIELVNKVYKKIGNGVEKAYKASLLGRMLGIFAEAGQYDRVPIMYAELLRDLDSVPDYYNRAIILSMAAHSIIEAIKKHTYSQCCREKPIQMNGYGHSMDPEVIV